MARLIVPIVKEQKPKLVSVTVSGLIGPGMGESASLVASGTLGTLAFASLVVVY
jgi:hypothetical protein